MEDTNNNPNRPGKNVRNISPINSRLYFSSAQRIFLGKLYAKPLNQTTCNRIETIHRVTHLNGVTLEINNKDVWEHSGNELQNYQWLQQA